MSRRLGLFTPLLLTLAIASLSGCGARMARSYRMFHFLSFLSSGPPPTIECDDVGDLKYCVHKAPEEAEEDLSSILYFLHHAGGSERSWLELHMSREYYSYFRRRDLPAPRVISVSYGPYWTLLDEPGPEQPALFRKFVNEDMPAIEKKVGRPRRRYLWGMSQGGLNVAELILKRPELFDGAVLSCPALYSVSIYADDDELYRYARRTGSDFEGSVMWGVRHLRKRVGGPEAWEREDPLKLVQTSWKIPPTLIQANREDEFGIFEGAEIFYRALRQRHQTVTFRPHHGGHCVIAVRQAVRFIKKLRY